MRQISLKLGTFIIIGVTTITTFTTITITIT